MLCEICNKNEATIYYTEIVNGIRTEHHICGECAKKMDLSGYAGVFNSEVPFVKLLTGLLASSGAGGMDEDNPMMLVKCPQCGMNFEEFTKIGKFGCAECYDVFGPLIEENMKKLHGSTQHRGKIYQSRIQPAAGQAGKQTAGGSKTKTGKTGTVKPAHTGKEAAATEEPGAVLPAGDAATSEKKAEKYAGRLAELNKKMQEAVELENFEEAARYRDQIKELKEGKKNA